MEWLWVILAGFLAVDAAMLLRAAFVPAEDARRLLADGAMIVDVRTGREFRRGHLPRTLNIPLGDLREQILLRVPDKNQSILVHCQSGGRSEIARRRLKKMGYVNVRNLGSLARARRIVSPHA